MDQQGCKERKFSRSRTSVRLSHVSPLACLACFASRVSRLFRLSRVSRFRLFASRSFVSEKSLGSRIQGGEGSLLPHPSPSPTAAFCSPRTGTPAMQASIDLVSRTLASPFLDIFKGKHSACSSLVNLEFGGLTLTVINVNILLPRLSSHRFLVWRSWLMISLLDYQFSQHSPCIFFVPG